MSDLTAREIEEAIRLLNVRGPFRIKYARELIKYADSDGFKNRLCEELSALTEAMEANGFEV